MFVKTFQKRKRHMCNVNTRDGEHAYIPIHKCSIFCKRADTACRRLCRRVGFAQLRFSPSQASMKERVTKSQRENGLIDILHIAGKKKDRRMNCVLLQKYKFLFFLPIGDDEGSEDANDLILR